MHKFDDAFISYGRIDSKAFGIWLYQQLTERGLKIWFDQNDIPLGVDFQHQIDAGIQRAHQFLFLISPHAVNSTYCFREIEMAVRCNKRIIPLLHVEEISQETCQQRYPGQDLSEWHKFKTAGRHSSDPNMHPAIRKINWVYFREGVDDYEKSLAGLLEIFERQKEYVQQHTYFLVKSLDWERQQKKSQYLLVEEERLQGEAWLKMRFKGEQPPCEPTDLQCEFICESTKNANNLMTQVYLCYAESDWAIAERISRTLMRESLTVWANKADIHSGTALEQAINKGIEGADNFVYLVSPDSLVNQDCQRELAYAFSLNKRVIPLRLKLTQTGLKKRSQRALDSVYARLGTPPPDIHELPAASLPDALQGLQLIDFTEHREADAYRIAANQLLHALSQDADYYAQHKGVLVKALKWQAQNRNPSILLRGYNLRHIEAWLAVAKGRSLHLPTILQEEFIAASQQQSPELSSGIFISYSPTDADFARKLNDALQMQGKLTWFDQESIASGADFQQEIDRGIEQADHFLLIVSPNSIHSPTCIGELDYAQQLHKHIVPLLYREVATADLPPDLANIQAISFQNHNGDFLANFGELIRTLETDLEYVRSHTRYQIRAMQWQHEEQDDSFLLRGKELIAAVQWLQQATNQQPSPTELQKQYITASRDLPYRKIKVRQVLLTSVVVTVLMAIARFVGIMQPAELVAYNHLLQLRPSETPDNRFLIIGIDEPSIRLLNNHYEPGRSTLPDQALLDLLNILEPYQPRLIGLDLYRDFAAQPDLASRLKQSANLIAVCKNTYDTPQGKIQGTSPPPETSPRQVGFSDFLDDANGGRMLRRHYLMQAPDPQFCNTRDAFNLVIARAYLEAEGHPFTSPLQGTDYVQDMQLGQTPIPQLLGQGSAYQNMNDQLRGYQTLLKYRVVEGDPNQIAPTISLVDALNGQLLAVDVKDRIVMIGFTADTSADADYWNTPYGELPGVVAQVHMASQLISATLDGRTLIWWWSTTEETLWIWSWAVVGGLVVWRLYRLQWQIVAVSGSLAGVYLICYGLLIYWSGWVPLIPPAIAVIATGTAVGYLNYRLRGHQPKS